MKILQHSGWERDSAPLEDPGDVSRSLLDMAREDGAELFAIVDGARDDRLFREISRGEVPHEPLYRGEAEKFFAVSPILVRCEQGTRLFEWLTDEAWGSDNAMFLTSQQPMDCLADHFVRFTVVRTDGDPKMFFRFYDPRVLQVYLPACSVAEREALFGPADRLAVEASDGAELLVFDREGGGLGPVPATAPLPEDVPYITPAQMDAFSEYMVREFIEAMVLLLAKEFPQRCEDLGDRMRGLIRRSVQRASDHGVLLECDVQRYLQCLLGRGEDFHEQPAVHDILTAEAVTGTVKMDRVEAHYRELDKKVRPDP